MAAKVYPGMLLFGTAALKTFPEGMDFHKLYQTQQVHVEKFIIKYKTSAPHVRFLHPASF